VEFLFEIRSARDNDDSCFAYNELNGSFKCSGYTQRTAFLMGARQN